MLSPSDRALGGADRCGHVSLTWVAQAQQEPPRGNDPPGVFQDASSTDLSPCFPARWHQVLLRPDTRGAIDPTVVHLVPRTAPVLGVLLILALHLSALIVWPVAAVVRRGSRSRAAAPRGFPRLTAGAVIALSVGFWWWVRASIDVVIALLMVQLPDVVSRLVFLELHPTGQMDWVGPGKLRWLADEVVRNCVYPPWLLTLFYIPYLRRRDGVRPVLGVAIVARDVVDRARARALHHRRDHARLVSVPSVRPGLHPLSPAARSQSAITAGARSPIDAPSASPVPFVRAGFRRAGADSSSRFAVGGSGTSYW